MLSLAIHDLGIRGLERILASRSWCAGSIICMEGQIATGVFVLSAGRAKESLVSREGKVVILRILGPGDSIGLSEILSGSQYETTIETLEPVESMFAHAGGFLALLRESDKLGLWMAQQLSNRCRDVYQEIRRLGLYGSIPQSMAVLILHWMKNPVFSSQQEHSRVHVFLTHEEIGQILGCTRETVSRVLGEFQRNGWISVKGGAWEIRDQSALEEITAELLAPSRRQLVSASAAVDISAHACLSGRNTAIN